MPYFRWRFGIYFYGGIRIYTLIDPNAGGKNGPWEVMTVPKAIFCCDWGRGLTILNCEPILSGKSEQLLS